MRIRQESDIALRDSDIHICRFFRQCNAVAAPITTKSSVQPEPRSNPLAVEITTFTTAAYDNKPTPIKIPQKISEHPNNLLNHPKSNFSISFRVSRNSLFGIILSLLRLATLFFFSLLPAPVSLISPVELEEREGRKEGKKEGRRESPFQRRPKEC